MAAHASPAQLTKARPGSHVAHAMWTPETFAVIALAFGLGGFVKGIVGMGLPLVALALLTTMIGLREAIALMLVPVLATNLWQATVGGAFWDLTWRLWPLLAATALFTWVGAGVLARADSTVLAAVLGTILSLYAAFGLTRPQLPPPGRHERWMTPAVGVLAGLATGMTGTFVVPGTMYLQALGLKRDHLVQALGIAFVVVTLALGVALAGHGLLPRELAGMSVMALAPTVLGVGLGLMVRRRLSEAIFRKVFFLSLLVVGLQLAARPLFQ